MSTPPTPEACRHCGQPLRRAESAFCCVGCEVVFSLLTSGGLETFYDLREAPVRPLLHYFTRQRDYSWADELALRDGPLVLDIEGVQCAACVWLIRELARRFGTANVWVDPTMGRLKISYTANQYPLKAYLEALQQFGYSTALAIHQRDEHRGLLLRVGICSAIAMNAMFIAISLYLGLGPSDGSLYPMFVKLNMGLSGLSVLVGGSYFIRRSWLALKQRMLHFDVPIALGIVAAYFGSMAEYLSGHVTNTFFDSVSTFVALMLGGRYVQSRFIARHRHAMLASPDMVGMQVRRLNDHHVEDVSFSDVRQWDRLLIPSGSMVPVESVLKGDVSTEWSTSWMTGEADPIVVAPGGRLQAGSVLVSRRAVEVEAIANFDLSSMIDLLGSSRHHEMLPMIWQWVTRWYVVGVLVSAFIGWGIWEWIDPSRSLSVVVSVLVATCPCAIGIAVPLARTLANRRLIAQGIFVRDGDLLDKLTRVRKVVFDKTGTLTLTDMKVVLGGEIDFLSVDDRRILWNMVMRSRHPISRAIYQYLAPQQLPAQDIDVEEIAGQGLVADYQGHRYGVGKSVGDRDGHCVVFSCDGQSLATIDVHEDVLDDVATVIGSLHREGMSVYMLSGDKRDRVENMARLMGIPMVHVRAEATPQSKRAMIRQMDHSDTMMIGDGLNDSLAFDAAFVCGAPLHSQSVMTDKGDFVFVSRSLTWVTDVMATAKQLKKVIMANLCFVAIYNVAIVIAAWIGLVSPLVCAVLMPASSVGVVALTHVAMRFSPHRKNDPWITAGECV